MRPQEPEEFKRQMKGALFFSGFALIGLVTAILLYRSAGFAHVIGSDLHEPPHEHDGHRRMGFEQA